MPCNFQFAFMGSQHNYLGRVTTISQDGWAQEDSITETYGLPRAFKDNFDNEVDPTSARRFVVNSRGHDFLSHGGQWTYCRGVRYRSGHNLTANTCISESSLLKSLKVEANGQVPVVDGLNMIASFGPKPGSIFVKAFSLRQYRWQNLPPTLEKEVQRCLNVRGYGKTQNGEIHDVTMNADGGWVIVFEEGKAFSFGGTLPEDLENALKDKQEEKRQNPKLDISIERVYLNHQNPREYVLLFKNGQCFVSLHANFQNPMETLYTKRANGNGVRRVPIRFDQSCECSEYSQRVLDALYYSKRGLFFLSRFDVDIAIKYLREATYQDGDSIQIRNRYCLAIISMRRRRGQDDVLEERIRERVIRGPRHLPPVRGPEHQDEDTVFRDEYIWMLNEGVDIADLENRLDELQRPFLDARWQLVAGGPLSEWSYNVAAVGG